MSYVRTRKHAAIFAPCVICGALQRFGDCCDSHAPILLERQSYQARLRDRVLTLAVVIVGLATIAWSLQ